MERNVIIEKTKIYSVYSVRNPYDEYTIKYKVANGEIKVDIFVMRMDISYMIWIGIDNGNKQSKMFPHLTMAMNNKFQSGLTSSSRAQNSSIATTLFSRSSQNATDQTEAMASRLSKRTGCTVYLCCDMDAITVVDEAAQYNEDSDETLATFIEKEMVKILATQ